jgi:putative transposase
MLEHLARRASSTQRLARRARIVLAAAEGYNNEQISRELRINRQTARLWRGVWLDAKAREQLGALEEVDKKESRRSI